jgi:hypothetical protein
MAVTAQQLWDAIKHVESGGNYKAHSKSSSASGVGQWIKSTWNNYGGYAEAWMAPPEVQEARGLHDVMNKLHSYGGDARKAAMSWFLPAAVNNPALAGKVPKANAISPNQYADKVLAALGIKSTATPGVVGDATGGTTADVPDPVDEANGTLRGQLANIMVGLSSGRNITTEAL